MKENKILVCNVNHNNETEAITPRVIFDDMPE